MTTHRISVSEDVRTGAATPANSAFLGVPMSNVVVDVITNPLTLDVDGITTVQAVGSAINLTINGARAQSVRVNGSLVTAAVLDVERNVTVTSENAGDTTQLATVSGYDRYGAPLKEVIAFNGAATIQGKKSFKIVTQIAISAATTGTAITAGFGNILGLAYAPAIGGFIRAVTAENTAETATYAPPPRTAQTSTSVNVRGTVLPTTNVPNDARTYTVVYIAKNGPQNTDAFGLAQYNG